MFRNTLRRLHYLAQGINNLGFAFGPPTPEYKRQYMASFYFQLQQIALSLRWDSHDSGHDFLLKVGPLGMLGTIGRRRGPLPEPVDQPNTLKIRTVRGGRELSTWRDWRHLGACFEWCWPLRAVKAEIGPFGAAIERGRR